MHGVPCYVVSILPLFCWSFTWYLRYTRGVHPTYPMTSKHSRCTCSHYWLSELWAPQNGSIVAHWGHTNHASVAHSYWYTLFIRKQKKVDASWKSAFIQGNPYWSRSTILQRNVQLIFKTMEWGAIRQKCPPEESQQNVVVDPIGKAFLNTSSCRLDGFNLMARCAIVPWSLCPQPNNHLFLVPFLKAAWGMEGVDFGFPIYTHLWTQGTRHGLRASEAESPRQNRWWASTLHPLRGWAQFKMSAFMWLAIDQFNFDEAPLLQGEEAVERAFHPNVKPLNDHNVRFSICHLWSFHLQSCHLLN